MRKMGNSKNWRTSGSKPKFWMPKTGRLDWGVPEKASSPPLLGQGQRSIEDVEAERALRGWQKEDVARRNEDPKRTYYKGDEYADGEPVFYDIGTWGRDKHPR